MSDVPAVAGTSTVCEKPSDDMVVDEACNSDDERGGGGAQLDLAATAALEAAFEERFRKLGFEIRRMAEDGNCLFRSIADRVYGDAEMHDVVRQLCMDHIEKERAHFSAYVVEDFGAYVARKRRDRVHGNHLEIQAASEIYNRPIHVYDGTSDEPINSYSAPGPPEAEATVGEVAQPLRLTYHGRSHYNALVDPNAPDVGVGLGLPGYRPGLADEMQLQQALGESEQDDIDAQILRAELKEAACHAACHAACRGFGEPPAHCGGTAAAAGSTSSSGAGFSGGGIGGGFGEYADEDEMLQHALAASLAPQQHAPPPQQQVPHTTTMATTTTAAATTTTNAQPTAAAGLGTHSTHPTTYPTPLRGYGGDGAGAVAAAPTAPQAEGGAEAEAEGVALLVAMGFARDRAEMARRQFGDDLESCLAFLTND